MAWAALGLSAETALFVLAGFIWFRTRAYTLTEAGAAAVLTVFMTLSLAHQICLFAGSPLPACIFELTALVMSIRLVVRRLPQSLDELKPAIRLLRRETLAGSVIAAACVILAGLLVVGWGGIPPRPSGYPWPGWPLLSVSGGLFQRAAVEPIPMLNAAGLFLHTTRFGLTAATCGFGLMAYLAVGCCTYALARRYAWPAMALTVTLMVLSMPRLVYLARWPSDELVSTAAVLFCLVLVYRLAEMHRPFDLRLFLVCILFSVSSAPISIGLAAVMVLLLLVIVVRRHGWLLLREMAGATPWTNLAILVPAILASQIVVMVLNRVHGHPLFGVAVPVADAGLLGTAVHLIGYVFMCADVTEPLQRLALWFTGLDLDRLLAGGYALLVGPLADRAGLQHEFEPIVSGREIMGFGPAALLLVLPSIAYAGLRGPRRLKAVCVAWAGYLYLAALTVGGQARSLAMLTPLMAASGFVVAFWLPPWRLRRRGMRLLQVLFAMLLAWSFTCI